jgi:hypothetical protein
MARVGSVAQPDHAGAFVEDHLEARVAPAVEVLGSPLEDELAVRR